MYICNRRVLGKVLGPFPKLPIPHIFIYECTLTHSHHPFIHCLHCSFSSFLTTISSSSCVATITITSSSRCRQLSLPPAFCSNTICSIAIKASLSCMTLVCQVTSLTTFKTVHIIPCAFSYFPRAFISFNTPFFSSQFFLL